jgi:hypothetical protein
VVGFIHINEFQNLRLESNLNQAIRHLGLHIVLLAALGDILFQEHPFGDHLYDVAGEGPFPHFTFREEGLTTTTAEESHCFAGCEALVRDVVGWVGKIFILGGGAGVETVVVAAEVR